MIENNKKRRGILKIIIALFLVPILLFGQYNISSDVLSIRDGLSSNNVRDIIQDKYGYIWIATADGVNYYDGYNVTVLKNIPGDSTSLPSNDTYFLFEDSYGEIWVGTADGLARFNRESKSFTTFRHSNLNTEYASAAVFLLEDSRNNLWVATLDGHKIFNRNSEKFERFDIIASDDNSIAKYVNLGQAMIETEDGEVYFLSQSRGLLKFDYKAFIFIQVALKNDFNKKLRALRIPSIIEYEKNILWIGTSNGLFEVNLKEAEGKEITPYVVNKNFPTFFDNAVFDLYEDRNKNIWVGTGKHGLFIYDRTERKFNEQLPSHIGINAFFEDNSGILWFRSSRGVVKFDFDNNPFNLFAIENQENDAANEAVLSFANNASKSNSLWLGSSNGIYLFNTKNEKLVKASSLYPKLKQLEGQRIRSVIEDSEQNLWIATVNQGLFSYNPKRDEFNNYNHLKYSETTILHNNIYSLLKDRSDNLWVGTQDGVSVLRKNKNDFELVPSFFNRRYETKIYSALDSLRKTTKPLSSIIEVGDYADLTKEFVLREDTKAIIYSVGEGLRAWNMVDYGWLESDKGDTIWSGEDFRKSFYATGGLKNRIYIGLLDLKSGRYKLKYKSDDSHSVESYNDMPPQDSLFWGTQLFKLTDVQYEEYLVSLKASENMDYIEGENIRVIFEDSKDIIWIGTHNGLSKVDPKNNSIQNFQKDLSSNNSLSNNIVRAINEDSLGNIWVATTDGLNKYNSNTSTFTVYREADGLPSNNLRAIEIDKDGNLWVSSVKGISKVELDENGERQIVVNYDVKDGLQGYEFLPNSSYIDENGKLYFAGIDGFNSFYPGQSNRTPPYLAINDINISNKSLTEVGDKDYTKINFNEIKEISLSHNQNDLSFELASIHYSRPDKNRILYKMEGIDDEWIVGDRRFASYTNLSPGDYVFNMRGSNGDGIWNDETRKINIYISAPWWNNWTAYTVYFVLFFGFLYSVRKIEIGRQQKNAQIKESQLRAESAELQAKAAEAQALVVQAENDRKSKELEEARQLQLSMLPRELPHLPNLDIAVYMKTATEVGGDYYDFHVGMDGVLTVVVGDATGHGMKAGTMVTTTKSLFNVLAPNPNIVETFHEMTRCLKLMHLEKLSMCMTMLKIRENKIEMSAAGMPPVFLYKRDSQTIEEHVMKGMPLGTFKDFPYTVKETELNAGDTLLLMSDGFPELMNEKKELYGYKRTKNLFEEAAEKSPEEIINILKNEVSNWMNNNDPDDDVTFVVIKVK